jgi:hypothetical protein
MKPPWFKRNRLFFLPVTIIGWTILLVGIIYAIWKFIDIDSKSHSVSGTLINLAFHFFIVLVVYYFIAFLTSKVARRKDNH